MRLRLIVRFSLIATLLLAFAAASIAAPSSKAYTPQPGSKERKAIMDALRKPVMGFVKKRVIFTQVQLTVASNWAYVFAQSTDAKGHPVGSDLTTFVSAVLRKSNGKWRTLQWAYATDVISIEWEKYYPNAPKVIWPHRRNSR